MKFFLLTISILLLKTPALLCQEFNLNEWLNTAYNDPMVMNIYDQSNYLRSAEMRTPNIDEVEFRTRSEDLNLSLDDIRLRLTFTNFGEIREGIRYNELLIQNYELEYQVRVHVAFVHRYELAIKYIRALSELELLQSQKLNLEDQITIARINVLNGASSIDDLLQLEKDLTDVLLKESELQNSLTTMEGQILSYYTFKGPITIELSNIAEPSEILEIIDSERTTINPSVALQQQDVELGLQETELEIKEGMGNLGFFQAEYERDPDLLTRENLGYQIGITLPIVNPDKARIERNKLKNLRQQQSLSLLIKDLELQTDIIEKELRELIEQYEAQQEQLSNLKERNKSLRGNYLEINTILAMKENELKMEEAITDRKNKIYTTFLKWLDKSGIISQTPLKNYLLTGFPVISK